MMPPHNQSFVVGVGTAIVDLTAYVEDSFVSALVPEGKGGTVHVSAARLNHSLHCLEKAGIPVVQNPGGSTGNLLCGLSRLGFRTAMFTKLGNDSFGDFYARTFEEEGGCSDYFLRTSEYETGRCLAFVTPDAERTFLTCLGASAAIVPDEIPPALCRGASLVHTESYLLAVPRHIPAVLSGAQTENVPVSMDLASPNMVRSCGEIMHAMYPHSVEILFGNETEFALYTGKNAPEEILQSVQSDFPVVGLKLGAKGSLVRIKDDIARIPAVPVKAVDTIGAGDYWQAGFIYGYLNHFPAELTGRIASMMGAAAVSSHGARIPAQKMASLKLEIQHLIDTFPR